MSEHIHVGIWAKDEKTFLETMIGFGLMRAGAEEITPHPQLRIAGPFILPGATEGETLPGLYWNAWAFGPDLVEVLKRHPVTGIRYPQDRPLLERTRMKDVALAAKGSKVGRGAAADPKRPERVVIYKDGEEVFAAYPLVELATPYNVWA